MTAALALSDLKIIEMAAIGPVPFAGMMFADMGARITRIDRIPANPPANPYGGFENRGRTSIAVNLKSPEGIATVLRLIDTADVLLEGFRPGVMERLGLGPEICLGRNPGLVYGRMTGWGQTGPLAKAAGHDINYIALTGALHAMGLAGQPPQPPLNLVGDYGGGAMMLALGVLAALHERARSGLGQVIDAAMTDGVAVLMSPFYSMLGTGLWHDERNANLLDGGAHFYGVYQCADGKFVSIGALEPQFYKLLLEKCGIEAAAFMSQDDRTAWPELREELERVFKTRTRDDWCAVLDGSDACFAPVLSLGEAPMHPHNVARQTFTSVDGINLPAPAPRFSRTPSHASGDIPAEGEHSLKLLAEIGFPPDQIARLLEEGTIYAAPGQSKHASGAEPMQK